ncbi:putative helicase mov-10-B.1 [Engraulis encrasicolus]|uniref:putative helicase mov-10-B.1 n=1 Tax=Engraulis encrasicolus TaxID=184585 RepID=UPI002FD33573
MGSDSPCGFSSSEDVIRNTGKLRNRLAQTTGIDDLGGERKIRPRCCPGERRVFEEERSNRNCKTHNSSYSNSSSYSSVTSISSKNSNCRSKKSHQNSSSCASTSSSNTTSNSNCSSKWIQQQQQQQHRLGVNTAAMPRFKWREIREVGMEFLDYLEETDRREDPIEKEDLRSIYNNEFRQRGVHPYFGQVTHVLKAHGEIRGCAGVIEPYRQAKLYDQRGVFSHFSIEDVDLTYLLTQDRLLLVAEKHGIRITSTLVEENGTISMTTEITQEHTLTVYVENTSGSTMLFTSSSFLKGAVGFTLQSPPTVSRAAPLHLMPGGRHEVAVRFKAEQVGLYQECLAFEFRAREPRAQPFHIARFLEVDCRAPDSTGRVENRNAAREPDSTGRDENRNAEREPFAGAVGNRSTEPLASASASAEPEVCRVGNRVAEREPEVCRVGNRVAEREPVASPSHVKAESPNSSVMEQLAPTAPYTPAVRERYRVEHFTVEDGERPNDMCVSGLVWERPLQEHRVPPHVGDLIKFLAKQGCSPNMRTQLLELKALLESPMSFENYCKRFQLLIQLEETQMLVDIRAYDMKDAEMTKDATNKRLLTLKVPGVAENRPSVLRGDHLLVIKSKERHLGVMVKYKGYVHRVECEQVKLGFGPKLMSGFIDGMEFDVEFTVNRLPVRLQMRAVELAHTHNLKDLLFPTGSKVTMPAELPKPRLFDSKLEKNPEQYSAVQNMVAGVSRPAPYLLFGPPGTGKTVTIVEAIKQVLASPSCSHILACAPSNSAADLLCERVLEHADSHRVYRIYASSRDPSTIPPALQRNCNASGGGIMFPSKEELMKYKILITTLVTAGRLVSAGFSTGHFSHVFVDEAGHATEPDTIIPLAGLLDPQSGQLVLAGDPKQLGPILRSTIAKKHGLEVSLLERLMKNNPLYQKDESGTYNQRYVTKLLHNYRSHKSILKVPNDLFYEGELIASADEVATSMYCNWEHLPKKGFPVIFHGVVGKDEREENSPSFFNRSEVEVVLGYLRKLLLETQGKKGVARISPKDIGIIAPYRKQVLKVRQAISRVDKDLKKMDGIDELKVGSVEEFQGQERRVIIVTAVRNSDEFLKIDKKFNIGFLKNVKVH